MKCPDCGAGLRVSREPHKYTLHPKWAITIADAEIRRCPRCGYFEVVIPRPDALHRTIAAEVIRKPARLSGPEFVFLRSQLGMSARGLAKTIGVVHESISRWENGVLPVSSPVDRLMRTMVALTITGEKFPVEALEKGGLESTPTARLALCAPGPRGWGEPDPREPMEREAGLASMASCPSTRRSTPPGTELKGAPKATVEQRLTPEPLRMEGR